MFAKLQAIREERESGFTLIELLVVILIIGILAAIAIPMFLNQRKSAVDSSVQSDVKNAATTVETWMVKNPATAVPQEQIGGATGNTATPVVLANAKIGTGTTLIVKPIAGSVGAYTLCAYNSGGDQSSSATNAIIWNSTGGGLQSGKACP